MLFSILLALVSHCSCARILLVAPTPSYSHQVIFQPIWRELALKGHDMVVITTNPINDPTIRNLKEINVGFAYDIWMKGMMKLDDTNLNNLLASLRILLETCYEIIDAELLHPEVNAVINNKTEHFDLVMVEVMLPAMTAFKHRFDCPFIGLASMDLHPYDHGLIGNSAHPHLYPDPFHGLDPNDGLLARLMGLIVTYGQEYLLYGPIRDRHNLLVEKHFGPGYPTLQYIMANVDMVFVNSDPTLTTNRLISRRTIFINGGIHIKEKKPLPEDIEKFMSGSKKGVIYFSLGSNVNSENLSVEFKRILLKVFSELPYNVLWKFEADDLPGKPDNVKIMKWIPQQDVLRHPNVKLFITQGGLQSMEEALFSYVPMIVIPFIVDQIFNAKKIQSKGLGLVIEKFDLMTEEEFKEKILEVIDNPKYRETVKKFAKLAKDEPMTPLERVVWWTEYVLRHKGAQHLKGPTMPFIQYYYLDVIALLVVTLSIILYINYRIIKMCCSFYRSKPKQKEQ